VWVGLPVGLVFSRPLWTWRALPVWLVLVLGFLVIAPAAEVYDRYGLLIFPAVALVTASGFAQGLANRLPAVRLATTGGLAVLTGLTAWQVVEAQRYMGQADTYTMAHRWILAHARPGDRIAVDSLYPRRLPQTREQLAALIAERLSDDAYARKWASNDFRVDSPTQPMRSAVLGDEYFVVHWLRRELSGRREGEGYVVTRYDRDPRFNSIPRDQAIAEFLKGLKDPAAGYDFFLSNVMLDGPVQPEVVFRDRPGFRLYLYVRPRSPAP
jgi:4-amino-4-deoxy-L-arabinose transferase-like glycosyltransferase